VHLGFIGINFQQMAIKMQLHRLASQIAHFMRAAMAPVRTKAHGVDVASLRPTARMSEAEKRRLYEAGRVSEMSEHDAGL
jgi:hypothetical protein